MTIILNTNNNQKWQLLIQTRIQLVLLLITTILTTNNNQKWQLLNQTTNNIQRLKLLIQTFRLRRCNFHFFIGQCQQVISKTVTKVDNIQVSMWITLAVSSSSAVDSADKWTICPHYLSWHGRVVGMQPWSRELLRQKYSSSLSL